MNIIKNIREKAVLLLPIACFLLPVGVTSCSSMLENESDLVEFEDNNKLNSAQDSLYSVMGIIRQMQVIADRTVLLGEVRADLMEPTDRAKTSVKQMANSDWSTDNEFNNIADFYAVINNCNFFINNADLTLKKLNGEFIFEKEYVAVKAYRAWTYLQLAKIYGEVPLITKFISTEKEAAAEMNKPYSNMQQICDFFINDLEQMSPDKRKKYVDIDFPQYGNINGIKSEKFFIPVRVLLGELCLWGKYYEKAANYFHDFLTNVNRFRPTGLDCSTWGGNNFADFSQAWRSTNAYNTSANSDEQITVIPLEDNEFFGQKSYINDVYNSTQNNYYYFQVTPSKVIKDLSAAQNYVYFKETSNMVKDTIYAPKDNLGPNSKAIYSGDLRLSTAYEYQNRNQDNTSKYNTLYQTINNVSTTNISLYRLQYIYLLFAEALNCAGFPESAFHILKYGLAEYSIIDNVRGISETERKEAEKAGNLLKFIDKEFKARKKVKDNYEGTTMGIHARGCGDVEYDTLYTLPVPASECSYRDSVEFKKPFVEQYIIDEMALETMFEGKRFYDLMRFAIRRNDPDFLATQIGKRNPALTEKLKNQKNWYLPIK